ncbi:MAG TPA: hypothetical protein VK528_06150 [Flavobacterium sp.]|nr:hypothetical protein [Flavobacterium sp.]
MKKILLLLALAGGGYYLFGMPKKDSTNVAGTTTDGELTPQSVMTMYNNSIVIDKDGIWFRVLNGKLALAGNGQASLDAFNAANNNKPYVNVPISVWGWYAANDQSVFEASF